ncbi:hypothetical protein ACKWTF_005291 [Chironomus riparius]
MATIREHYNKKVCYFYDAAIGESYFGEKHPMKPFRIVMAHNLIMKYGLYKKMKIYRPYRASKEDMFNFHADDYVIFLKNINEGFISNEVKELTTRFSVGTKENDCPVFKGVFDLAQISSGGSLSAAANIVLGNADIAINWSGGLHHAKKAEARGFCYVNDIVLCILELLKFHKRVLYIDIDVHHGDGVEEAFFTTDRVMTVSFHRFGDEFFPGTGGFNDIGAGKGKYYSINVPLKAGLNDDDYEKIFIPVIIKVMEVYDPSVIVLQCGADSLAGDRLGDFNLTLKGHGRCVEFMRRYNIPLILLGGGGYTVKNVSRCWCYETAIALNTEIPDELPPNDFSRYFKPITKLHIKPEKVPNYNTPEYLDQCIEHVYETLRNIQSVPSVQFMDSPPLFMSPESVSRLSSIRTSTPDSVQSLSPNTVQSWSPGSVQSSPNSFQSSVNSNKSSIQADSVLEISSDEEDNTTDTISSDINSIQTTSTDSAIDSTITTVSENEYYDDYF